MARPLGTRRVPINEYPGLGRDNLITISAMQRLPTYMVLLYCFPCYFHLLLAVCHPTMNQSINRHQYRSAIVGHFISHESSWQQISLSSVMTMMVITMSNHDMALQSLLNKHNNNIQQIVIQSWLTIIADDWRVCVCWWWCVYFWRSRVAWSVQYGFYNK